MLITNANIMQQNAFNCVKLATIVTEDMQCKNEVTECMPKCYAS